MRRFYTEPENVKDGEALLEEDAGHITKVLRMAVGDEVVIFDGTGLEYTAQLTQIDSRLCRAKILETRRTASEPEIRVSLFQGIPKAGKMELIVQKAVELGVSEIYPVMTERSVVRLNSAKDGQNKAERWAKVAQEAVKQCGRAKVPPVSAPIGFEQALQKAAESELILMPYEELGHAGEHGLKELLRGKLWHSAAILIGPEGGFSDAEVKAAAGTERLHMVGLGSRILRTETAGSTVLSVIMYENDEI